MFESAFQHTLKVEKIATFCGYLFHIVIHIKILGKAIAVYNVLSHVGTIHWNHLAEYEHLR